MMAQRTYSMCGRGMCWWQDGSVLEQLAQEADAEEESHAGQESEKSRGAEGIYLSEGAAGLDGASAAGGIGMVWVDIAC